MGRLAVYKFAYFLSILFTIFILGLSIFAYFSGKINPVENMFAAYVALSKPIPVSYTHLDVYKRQCLHCTTLSF